MCVNPVILRLELRDDFIAVSACASLLDPQAVQ